ncbi:MAG: glycosyltransferase, partial [Terriglobia bacterium]
MVKKPVIVGHPFAPTGRGEDARALFRAFKASGMSTLVRDVYGLNKPYDPDYAVEMGDSMTDALSDRINVYCLNGDEVAQASAHMERDTPAQSYKIVYPAWELSKYPADWARYLERFDEVWAPSKFTRDALTAAVNRPVHYMPLASEVRLSSFLGRRYFGIPESSFVFLFMFDFTSYVQRKNPFAVIEAYQRYVARHPFHDTCLVLKLNNPHERTQDFHEFQARCQSLAGRLILIEKALSDNETKNLVRNCDCFLSLHRSEGFGRGLSEAMFLAKPVIATAYSANMDFMTSDNACLVDYDLVPVQDDHYPYAQGQVWADARIDAALDWMERLVGNAAVG